MRTILRRAQNVVLLLSILVLALLLREGRVTPTFDASEATQETFMAAATLAEAHA